MGPNYMANGKEFEFDAVAFPNFNLITGALQAAGQKLTPVFLPGISQLPANDHARWTSAQAKGALLKSTVFPAGQ